MSCNRQPECHGHSWQQLVDVGVMDAVGLDEGVLLPSQPPCERLQERLAFQGTIQAFLYCVGRWIYLFLCTWNSSVLSNCILLLRASSSCRQSASLQMTLQKEKHHHALTEHTRTVSALTTAQQCKSFRPLCLWILSAVTQLDQKQHHVKCFLSQSGKNQ